MADTTRSLASRTALTAAAVASTLTLAACGSSSATGAADPSPGATTSAPAPVSPGPHNQADVTFAQDMIVHHRQAIAMAEMAQTNASSGDIKALAAKIEKEQGPEIDTMSGWLKAWGEQVPQATPGATGCPSGMPGMMGSPSGTPGMMGCPSGMPGMIDDQQMSEMTHASGHAFDTIFLTMMIEHHQGAVEMARTEQAQGAYSPAKALAGDIITAQTAEITQMRQMSGSSSAQPTSTT
ncbi:DUF305 domain-containing protein [Kitasatospora cathayae]|uniref:DUF305 domain-containing protein n=1 Tax=Kitasatospora cathayae TaxID=3004092 RepID=A0ABY7PXE9_9ACTN|nr:DUF305 domain-containing protein [Kitasatospora sp. HUAS 3-15]WBP85108.1 DUF305 domain-containing protein [Kitasatospora sp. HUAS 3-15]